MARPPPGSPAEFITLDGVIQPPGGADEDRDGGFAHGGWTQPYWHDDIDKHFMSLMKDVDTFLLGRRTYVTHAEAFEPMPAGDGVHAPFTLKETTPYPSGVVGLHYVRAIT